MKDEQETPVTEVENETTPVTENPVDEVGNETTPETDGSTTTESTVPSVPETAEIIVTSPIDPREMTVLETGKGDIHIIHEITFGDAILSTLIMALLIFMFLDRVVRR